MRVSRFWALAEDEFGATYAHSLAGSTHMSALGGRTAGRPSTPGCRRATSGSPCATRWTCPRTGGTASTSHLAAEQTPWSPSAPSTRVRAVGDDILLRARGLTKRFGDFAAVDGIDVEVRRGEAFGFLGPNGAGKSSTMRMVGCVSPVTAGELTHLRPRPGTDGPQIRARLGVVPAEGHPRRGAHGRGEPLGLRPLLRPAPAEVARAPTSCSSSPSSPTGGTTRSSRSPAA